MSSKPGFCMLMILDGWGLSDKQEGNAVALARTPFLDKIKSEYQRTSLLCSGEAVGLPEGIMGNSEVGHLNIGAGRVVYQDLLRIDKAIRDKSFFENEVEISNLDVLGTTLGQANCFGAVKGKVKAGPMTFFRISTDDTLGMIKSYLGEGEFTDDAYGMDGGIAVTRVQNLQTLLKYLCKNGFEHHVAMVRGNVSGILAEAIDSYLGWDLHLHE